MKRELEFLSTFQQLLSTFTCPVAVYVAALSPPSPEAF